MPYHKKYLGTVRADDGDITHFIQVNDAFVSFSPNSTPHRIHYELEPEHLGETDIVGDPVIVDDELHFTLLTDYGLIDYAIIPGVEGFYTLGWHEDTLLA